MVEPTLAAKQPATTELSERGLRSIMAGLLPVTAMTQLLGFASSIALAYYLGINRETDAYYVALIAPGIASAVILTAMRQGAVPALMERLRQDSVSEFNSSTSALVTAATAVGWAIALVLGVGAVVVLPMALPSWPSRYVELASLFSLMLIPYAAGSATQGAMSAVLAVKGRFKVATAVVACESVSKIFFVVVLPHLGGFGLVMGNLTGQLVALAVLWLSLRRVGVSIGFAGPRQHPFIVTALAVSAPLLISQAVLQVNPFVDRAVASSFDPGAVSAFELGSRIALLPQMLLATTMISPMIASWSARRQDLGWSAVSQGYVRAVSLSILGTALVVSVLFPLRHEVIQFVYGSSKFTDEQILWATGVFGMLLFSLPGNMMNVASSSLFVVEKRTLIPMLIGIVSVVVNLGATLALAQLIGISGIALGTAVQAGLSALVYLVAARSILVVRGMRRVGVSVLIAVVGGIAAAAATSTLSDYVAALSSGSRAAGAIAGATVGAITFGLVLAAATTASTRFRLLGAGGD